MNLNQVTLPARDVARSAEFYRLLGFAQIVSNLPHYVRFECRDGGATFSLHQVESPAGSETIIYFECDNLDGVYEAHACLLLTSRRPHRPVISADPPVTPAPRVGEYRRCRALNVLRPVSSRP
jgi:catechol 2,3-dioxygenase-like lactoylglutathione lyase family enzyme